MPIRMVDTRARCSFFRVACTPGIHIENLSVMGGTKPQGESKFFQSSNAFPNAESCYAPSPFTMRNKNTTQSASGPLLDAGVQKKRGQKNLVLLARARLTLRASARFAPTLFRLVLLAWLYPSTGGSVGPAWAPSLKRITPDEST